MDIQELLALIDENIIINILNDLGSPCTGTGMTSNGVKYLMFRTICHNGNSNNKLWWYEDTKSFQCWTCCGSMSIFNLVMKIKNCSFKESLIYISDKVGINFFNKNRFGLQELTSVKNINSEIADMDKRIKDKDNKVSQKSISKFYDNKILRRFDSNAFYQGWINEGITEETMRKYNISFYWMEGHIIIPHYDEDNNLIGIRRRSLNPEDAKNKYMPEYINGVLYDHPLGLNFYGLNKNKTAIKKQKKVVIVEGEKSVMLSDSYYGEDSITIATCGFNISSWQIKTLKKLGVNTVYLGFDKDYDITKEQEYKKDANVWTAYDYYKTRLQTLGERLGSLFKVYILYDKHNMLEIKDSPLDKGKEVFEKIMKEAKLIKMG